jgi:hypothetical protein
MALQSLQAYNTISLLSGADLSARQWRFVKGGDAGKVISCDTTGEQAAGVNCGNVDAADKDTPVQIGGVAKVDFGGTVAAWGKVMTDTVGRAIAHTGANVVLGIAPEGGASGARYPVILLPSDGTPGGGLETVSAPGAIAPSVYETHLAVDGTDAFTMGDGLYVGQRKRVTCITAANTPLGTVTLNGAQAAFGSEPTAHVFTSVGQAIEWEWTATGWKIVDYVPAGIEVVANAATANPLCLLHTVSIADTVDFILGAGLVPGQRSHWIATANSGTPVGTISGLFYDEDGSADGTDVNMNAAGDSAFLEWTGARWLAITLVSATVS